VSPESGAVNVRARSVVFVFDAVVSDRPSGIGGNLDNVFIVSPDEGRPRVRWRRNRIEVRPRRDFRPNTAYSVTMLPGIADLRGNVLRSGRTIVFSTGPVIPPYSVLGRVFDWMRERVAPNAIVEAIRHPDSARYVGAADSTGQFAIGPLDEGTYTVRAYLDNNNNRGLDSGEPWDSVPATVRGSSPYIELLAAPRDTIPPRLLTVSTPDTLTLIASFDRPLDPTLPLLPTSFRVVSADSVRLNVASVRTSAEVAAEEARRDSVARRDSLGRDTSARRDTARVRRVMGAVRPPGTTVTLKPSKPVPTRDVVIRLDSLTPMRSGGSYRVTAVNMRGLLGHVRTSDREITMPIARPDSAAAKPGAGVRRP
jgi:Big-like domain-containing protein